MSLVSRVPPSCLPFFLSAASLRGPWVLLSPPIWYQLSLFTPSSFPHLPPISLQGDGDVSTLPPSLPSHPHPPPIASFYSLLMYFSFPFGSLGFLQTTHHSHQLSSQLPPYLSSDDSPTFVQACGCRDRPTHTIVSRKHHSAVMLVTLPLPGPEHSMTIFTSTHHNIPHRNILKAFSCTSPTESQRWRQGNFIFSWFHNKTCGYSSHVWL